ncbi:legume-like lectin family protein [Diplocarpon rosae]|nr:legume-like lectin family protein [Diplocarpon rosae]
MHFSTPLSSLASALFFTYAQASYLQNDISQSASDVPNWHLMSKPLPPQILSNKILLTPPAPGNQRGAAWSRENLEHLRWSVDVDFRATGPERGSGNLQIWYVKDGYHEVGLSSIYTVGKFDGFALVIDQYAGSGGSIRGFLNDGTTDYSSHHSVDSIAFGHCQYSYRNLGRPSRITMQQSSSGFKVTVDEALCFESSKVKLPSGNEFGITAASAEVADSFEIFKFVTVTDTQKPEQKAPGEGARPQTDESQAEKLQQKQGDTSGPVPDLDDPPEAPASNFQSSAEQFADLHNRLQSMTRHISSGNAASLRYRLKDEAKMEELITKISSMDDILAELKWLRSHLTAVQTEVQETKKELHESLQEHTNSIKSQARNTHNNLHRKVEDVAARGVGFWGLVGVVAGSNVVLVVVYTLYKRRKSGEHMKYL